jgi:hypothetical protein
MHSRLTRPPSCTPLLRRSQLVNHLPRLLVALAASAVARLDCARPGDTSRSVGERAGAGRPAHPAHGTATDQQADSGQRAGSGQRGTPDQRAATDQSVGCGR